MKKLIKKFLCFFGFHQNFDVSGYSTLTREHIYFCRDCERSFLK